MFQPSSLKRIATTGAVFVWLSLLLQLYVAMQHTTVSMLATFVRFFSYFTVSTNILIAICLTVVAVKGISITDNFFGRPNTLTATAVYISIVSLTYNAILRFQWAPTGLTRVPDELLHLIIPVLYLIFWGIFVPKQQIKWSNILPWAIYPVVYLGYTLLRGPVVHWYPYPFLNVDELGYGEVLINSAIVCLVFVVFSLIFVGLSKMGRKKAT